MKTTDNPRVVYSVWVGGMEINTNEIETRQEAEKLAYFWRNIQGYDDVSIEEVLR